MERKVLMPKAVALWLKINTDLSFEQISKFCSIDLLTLDTLTSKKIQPMSPLITGELTEAEIKKGEKDLDYDLKNHLNIKSIITNRSRKYIPISYKIKRPMIIGWFLTMKATLMHVEHLVLEDAYKLAPAIAKTLSTKVSFVEKRMTEIITSPKEYAEICDPIKIGVCSKEEVQKILDIVIN
jgi:hypothetical protein